MASTAPQLRTAARGPIERGVLYPYDDFLRRTGFGRKTLAKLRNGGMPVRRVGRNSFILGDDFLDALLHGDKAVS
jgi:hypothetical protein